jgi:hypothetical protein
MGEHRQWPRFAKDQAFGGDCQAQMVPIPWIEML